MYTDASPMPSRRKPPRRAKRSSTLQDLLLTDNKALPKGYRVSGIYEENGKFRVVVFCPDRQSIWCKTREEAEAVTARLRQKFHEQSSRTVGQAIVEYMDYRIREGQRPNTLRTVGDRLHASLPADRMLHTITPEFAAELYSIQTQRITRYGRPMAAASHRAALKNMRCFFRWLVEDRKYLSANPFDHIKPVGRVNTGKPQLRLDEARKLKAWLVKQAENDERATAVLTQLILGLRSAEVLRRQVRDVDDNGKLFCIESGKTKNARRWLEIRTPQLQRLLAKQVQGRKPDDLLFGAHRSRPYSTTAIWKWLRQFCRAAQVSPVCPHSLRGLHSTLAMEHGATSGVVAAALGHGSFDITQRHYVQPGTMENLKQAKVSAALETPQTSAPTDLGQLIGMLQNLSPDQLAQIMRTVGPSH